MSIREIQTTTREMYIDFKIDKNQTHFDRKTANKTIKGEKL